MNKDDLKNLSKLAGLFFQPHPWHGIYIGDKAPNIITVYIEIVPTDTIKYELDKKTGYIKVDRPQRYSNVCPTMYGLIPQTYCWDNVAELCADRTNRRGIIGDGDPLDICVIADKSVTHGGIILEAIPVGGFRMIDRNESDDKIISVMKDDPVYGDIRDIKDIPSAIIQKLRHYFLTYKELPGAERSRCEITHIFGRDEAIEVINRSRMDYQIKFKSIEENLGLL